MRNSYYLIADRRVRIAVIRGGIQRAFVRRLRKFGAQAQKIVIASPWISNDDTSRGVVTIIGELIGRRGTPTYVFTRPPETAAQARTLDILKKYSTLELVYNRNLHAKIYVCLAPYPYGFAILGSANLTERSEQLYEIGLVVLAGGGGDEIVKELADFGLSYLRTRPDSQIVKKLGSWRCINGI